MLRDRLLQRLAEMGQSPDYARLAAEVLAIRNAPPAVARRLVEQALVVGDRREVWQQAGDRACATAPERPGVYIFLDAHGSVIYVGKALRLRRRLRAHFAPRRWTALKPQMARVAKVDWHLVGSELEALLVEAVWIRQLSPQVNVQRRRAQSKPRLPASRAADLAVILPAAEQDLAFVAAARRDGCALWLSISRTADAAASVAPQLARFFAGELPLTATASATIQPGLASMVSSWLAQRGSQATRLAADDCESAADWERRLTQALTARELFSERLHLR